jgi:hypothetical protein
VAWKKVHIQDSLLSVAAEDYNYGFALGLAGRKEGKGLATLKNAYSQQNTDFERGLVEGYFSPKQDLLTTINTEENE